MALHINHQTNDITTDSGKVKLNGTELGGTGGSSSSSSPWYGDRGILSGFGAFVNNIDYYDITTTGNSSDFGDHTGNGSGFNGWASNGTRGVMGGAAGTNLYNSTAIDYITIATTGNAADFGDLTVGRRVTGLSNGTYAVFAGGGNGDTIDYITIASTGNATDFGNLLANSSQMGGGWSDATRGVFVSGNLTSGTTDQLEYVTIGSPSNSTDFGDLLTTTRSTSACSDTTRGVVCGGNEVNTIQYLTTQTTGNATDFGDLTGTTREPAAASNATRAVVHMGKKDSSWSNSNTQDYFTIQTLGNASTFGNVTTNGNNGTAATSRGCFMSQVVTKPILFSLPVEAGENINQVAASKVAERLPEIDKATRAFDRQNSQTTINMMTLTMLNGHSPMRMLRQILAEVEKRKMALSESQVKHAELREEIMELEGKDDAVSEAKLRHARHCVVQMENKINGGIKDIATMIDAYDNIKVKHGIDEWDETTFEAEEKRHHVRRGFELMYRNLMDGSRASTATIEYMCQYGVHPQVGLTEVSGYIQHTASRIANHDLPHSNDLEDFLDQMADKYCANADKTAERIFGKSDFVNEEYMLKLEAK